VQGYFHLISKKAINCFLFAHSAISTKMRASQVIIK
jgi:hypothetical protein